MTMKKAASYTPPPAVKSERSSEKSSFVPENASKRKNSSAHHFNKEPFLQQYSTNDVPLPLPRIGSEQYKADIRSKTIEINVS